MMRSLFSIALFFCLNHVAFTQQWAGVDKSSCGELGVVIGSNDACQNCCYSWSPEEGLDDPNVKNPTARPKTTTTYTVKVVGPNLQPKGNDQVKVSVDFGEMVFSPEFLIQGSEESESHVYLRKLGDVDQPSEISWTFQGPTLGCEMTPQGVDVLITPGNFYGDVTVRASKVSVPGCYVEGMLPVNNGVKDVFAIDPHHPGRMAKTGETLYMINHDSVIIHAIPNPGGFAEGIPDWKDDAYFSNKPPDGEDYVVVEQEVFGSDITSDYIAGDEPDFKPKVRVVRKPIQIVDAASITLPGFAAVKSTIEDVFKFKKAPHVQPACGDIAPLFVTVNTPNFSWAQTTVEKYNHPGLSKKNEVTGSFSFVAGGRIYHPFLTRSIQSKRFNIAICSKLYAELSGELGTNIKVTQDPSKPDSTWKPEGASVELVYLKLSIGGALEFGVAPPGYKFTISGKISSSLEYSIYVQDAHVLGKAILLPASIKLSAKVQQLSDLGKYEDLPLGIGSLSRDIQLFEAIETPPVEIADLNLFDE